MTTSRRNMRFNQMTYRRSSTKSNILKEQQFVIIFKKLHDIIRQLQGHFIFTSLSFNNVFLLMSKLCFVCLNDFQWCSVLHIREYQGTIMKSYIYPPACESL